MRRGLLRPTLCLMLNPARTILTSLPLVGLPALAADANYETGITSVGPAMFIFTIAGALLLTLVFRSAANHAAQFNLALARLPGDPRGALRALRCACELADDEPRYWAQRGRTAYELGLTHEAVASLTRAVELDPKRADWWSSRGSAELGDGDINAAERSFQRAIDLEPKNPRLRSLRAQFWFERGQYAKSIDDLDVAINKLASRNPNVYFQRGLALARAGQRGRAREDLNEALRRGLREPQAAYARRQLANLGP